MKKTIIAVILFVVLAVSTITAQTTDNPDRYASIKIGMGIASAEGIFTTPAYPTAEWKRYINTPSYHFEYIQPATDYLSVIMNVNYYKGDINYFDYNTPTAPTNTTKTTYNYSIALKFYIK